MNRTASRFFPIFSLLFALLVVWQPVRAMDPNMDPNRVIHQEDGQNITQGDINAFRAGKIDTSRFFALRPVFAKYKSILNYVDYGTYQKQTPQKLNEFADFFLAEFAKKKAVTQPSSSSNSSAAPVAPVIASPIIYKDNEIIITQKDRDDFADQTLSEDRFNEILPTLSDLTRYKPTDFWYIGDLTYQQYKDKWGDQWKIQQAVYDIGVTIRSLEKATWYKTVTRNHPKHQERARAKKTAQVVAQPATNTATGGATTSTSTNAAQAVPKALFQDKKITITRRDLDAFKNGTMMQKRFEKLAPKLAEYNSELDGMTYFDYKDMVEQEQERCSDIIDNLSETLNALATEQAEIKREEEAQKARKINLITQADIDAFEYNELTEKRFDELKAILQSEGMDAPLSYQDYVKSGSLFRLVMSFGKATLYDRATISKALMDDGPMLRTQMTQMLVMGLNMQGAQLSIPAKRATTLGALWAAGCGVAKLAIEGIGRGSALLLSGVATVVTRENHVSKTLQLWEQQAAQEEVRKKAEAAQEEVRKKAEAAEEKKLNDIMARADRILEKYTDEYIDGLIDRAVISTMDQAKKQKIKEQNCMIAGGLMPEQIDLTQLGMNIRMDIGKDMPYPIALYKKDLVYGAGFATKACIAYWTISQISKYRADYIYKQVLEHTDEFITLLKELHTSTHAEAPQQKSTRTWKQYGIDKISGKNNDSDQLYNLKQHIDTHHSYIGYNPMKFPLLGHLAILLFSKAGIAHAYDKLIIHDDTYAESRSAYYKDEDGNLRRLPGMYSPISVTQAAQSLSLSGLWSTAVGKIPPTVRSAIPVPLSKREIIEKLEPQTPEKIRTFLKSETASHLGLFALSVFEIKFMNDLYHARWNQWVLKHQEYLIDLLERYQKARALPQDDETRTLLEEEILLSIKEGNALSGINRATVWRGIARTAFNKVTFAFTAPIIAYAVWNNKEILGQLGLQATKKMGEYLRMGVQMAPLAAMLCAQGAAYAWNNPADVAQGIVIAPLYAARMAGMVAFEVAKVAAVAAGGAVIITGATIAQNEKVQKYATMAVEKGATCLEVGKYVASSSMKLARKIARKLNFKR